MKKFSKKPLVSVIMPARNAGKFLVEAIDSILGQTYKNFELIIINDASRDETSRILSMYKRKDKRIKLITNKSRLGVSRSASLGIIKAKGAFIARMDADDIAYPTRLEKQVKFLLGNKHLVAAGGQCDLIDSSGSRIGEKKFPQRDSKIREMIFMTVPMQQPTLMVNRNILPSNFVWYEDNYSSAEELSLLFKLFQYGELANLKEKVLSYRIHGENTSLINPKQTFYLTLRTRIASIFKYGYTPSLNGIVATVVQALLITILPSSWIYPLYCYLRGLKKFDIKSVRINWNVQLVKA